MSEMIERVAKAILKEQQTNRSAFPDSRDIARAAIEAMREPTSAMAKAAYRDDAPQVVWRDMIDEALK